MTKERKEAEGDATQGLGAGDGGEGSDEGDEEVAGDGSGQGEGAGEGTGEGAGAEPEGGGEGEGEGEGGGEGEGEGREDEGEGEGEEPEDADPLEGVQPGSRQEKRIKKLLARQKEAEERALRSEGEAKALRDQIEGKGDQGGKGRREEPDFSMASDDDYIKAAAIEDPKTAVIKMRDLQRRDAETIVKRLMHEEKKKLFADINRRQQFNQAINASFEKAQKRFGGKDFGDIVRNGRQVLDSKIRKRADEIYDGDPELRRDGPLGIFIAFSMAHKELMAEKYKNGAGKGSGDREKISRGLSSVHGRMGQGAAGGGGGGSGAKGKFTRTLTVEEYRKLPDEDKERYKEFELRSKRAGRWPIK